MLEGKGFYIWKIKYTEHGDVGEIARLASKAGFSHVLVKIADGKYAYNIDYDRKVDLVPGLKKALKDEGIECWGWHFVYGDEPEGEAQIALQRIHGLGLDGYVIDAEGRYAKPGKAAAARTFMKRLRNNIQGIPIALSSYRYPSYHPYLPWDEFLSKCDLNMPQVYWLKAHNAGWQLQRSVSEFQNMTHRPPIIPTGAAYTEWGWSPQASEIQEFLETAQSLNLKGANFWEWSNCREKLPSSIWKTIEDFPWQVTPDPTTDITEELVETFNTHNPRKVIQFYDKDAVHITAARTVKGIRDIRKWYNAFFVDTFPQASFSITGHSGAGRIRHFTWKAQLPDGSVKTGHDTLGLTNGAITYHFTLIQ
jgi:hypothetical protein